MSSESDHPECIGPYRIRKRLGAGGVGEVYLGARPDGPEVAIKVLRHEGSTALQRFVREARLLALLYHPLIVGVLDSDLEAENPWFAMDYVKGRPLNRLIAGRERSGEGFTVEEIVKIGHDLAQGLAAAHSVGVYHRDIKPANLLLDEAFDLHLLDFGLARDMGSLEKLTQEGSFLGTMSYCSPEQFKGQRGDSRTDVYQAGLVLYELCTLHLPFDDKAGMAPVVLRCQGQPLPPPSHARPGLPPRLERIVFQCLHVDPARRYPTARELLDEILGLPVNLRIGKDQAVAAGAIESGAPSQAPPTSPLETSAGASSSGASSLASSLGRPPADLPERIGGHTVLGTLGEGGMGRVFLVRKDEREMAMKVLSAEARQNKSHLLRFRREIETLSELIHPNVVRIFEHGSQDGIEWFTMEYVPANSLRGLLDLTQTLPPQTAVHVASSIAAALAFCHPRNILHRDIKPENVLVDGQRRVKLTDFGLALPTDATSLTRTGEMLGTLAYITPEMLSGQKATAASDLFQLGLLLYEVLTGSHFFPGHDLAARKAGATGPVRLPAFLATELRETLAKIIQRCLQADPKARYADAGALLADLRRVGEGFAVPGTAPPSKGPRRKGAQASRRPSSLRRGGDGTVQSSRAVGRGRKTLHLTGGGNVPAAASPADRSGGKGFLGAATGVARIVYKLVVGAFILLLVLVSLWVIFYLPRMQHLPGSAP